MLKSIGGIAAATSSLSVVGGSVVAGGSDDGVTMVEAGVEDEFNKLFRSGKFGKAVKLLEESGVDYDAAKVGLGEYQGRGRVGMHDDLDKGDTTLWLCGGNVSGDTYQANLGWDPSLTGDLADCVGEEDIVAISWPDDRWRFKPGSQSLGEHTDSFDPNPEGCTARYSDYAAIAGFDDPQYMSVELEKTESGDANVYGHYSHNWEPFCVGGGSVSFGITAGSLTVTTNGLDHWEKPSPTMVR